MIQPVTYTDFSGGIVDDYLATDRTKYAEANNLLIDPTGNLNSRDGLAISPKRVPTESTYKQLTGIYFYPQPFDRGVFVLGRRAYENAGTYTEIPGYSGVGALVGKNEGGLEQLVFWRGQLIACPNGYGYTTTTHTNPHRLYCTSYGSRTYQAVTCGLPRPIATVTQSSTAGTKQFIYALHYYYELTDFEGTVFVEQGPVLFYVMPVTCTDPATNSITLSNLPVLSNGGTTNYDTTNVKVKIFRTLDVGTTYYYSGQVTNGTTSYVDTVGDATLVSNAVLYTDGGRLEWTQPPQDSIFVAQVNDYFWYAGKKFITHTIQGAAGASPALYVQYTDQTVRGLSDVAGFPILFCDKSVYRVEGNYDEFGNQGFSLREIHSTAGCWSSRAVVKVPGGLAWPGNGGFYFTDGYQVTMITGYLPVRYEGWRNTQMVGHYDSQNQLVYWAASTSTAPYGSNLPSNDSIVVWHQYQGVKPASAFTRLTFQNNIYPTSLWFSDSIDTPATYRSKMMLGDARGYFLWFDPLRHCDPKIDESLQISSFYDKAIVWDFRSAGLTENPAARNYTTHVALECETNTDVAVQIYHRRDDTGAWVSTPELRADNYAILWNITDCAWNDTVKDPEWNSTRILEGRRFIPQAQLRSQRRQVRITNATTTVYRSDDYATVNTVAGVFPTITLTSGTWPDSPEELYIGFDSDSYVTTYRVKQRISNTVITVFDPYQTMTTTAARKWQMSGVRKNERLRLLSFTLYYEAEGDTQTPSTATVGVNS